MTPASPSRPTLPVPVSSHDPTFDAKPAARRSTLWSAVPVIALLLGATAQVAFFSYEALELASHRELARVDGSTPASMRAVSEARAERRAVKAELRRVRAETRRARRASHRASRAAERAEAAAGAGASTSLHHEYSTIDRAALEDALANPATLAAQARVIPSVRDGVVQGYKLYGVKPGSLPMMVGFQSGDLVTEINGRPLADGGYSHRLDTVPGEPPSVVTFTVVRRGAHVRKIVEIR